MRKTPKVRVQGAFTNVPVVWVSGRRARLLPRHKSGVRATFVTDEWVVKVDRDHCYDQCKNEVKRWKTAPDWVKDHLVPLVLWGRGWVMQPRVKWFRRCNHGDTTERVVKELDLKDTTERVVKELNLIDMHSENFFIVKGGKVMIHDWGV